MALFASGNWINVRPGSPAFVVGSNYCDCFELGVRAGADYWLIGESVAGEFVFNGRLFLPHQGISGVILDNFPKSPTPIGWTRQQRVGNPGYDLVSDTGVVLFGYEVVGNKLCHVTVNIYDRRGSIVAATGTNGFLVQSGPVNIGRGGIVIG